MKKKAPVNKFAIFMIVASIIAVLLGVGVFYWLNQLEPLPSSYSMLPMYLETLIKEFV